MPALQVNTMSQELFKPDSDISASRTHYLLAYLIRTLIQVNSTKKTKIPNLLEILHWWEDPEEKKKRERAEKIAARKAMLVLPGDDDFHT